MTKELKLKLIRFFVISLIFISLVTLQGVNDQRQANQQVFMVLMIGSFSLLVGNVWIMAFLIWTCFLFTFFKFEGGIYLNNVFFSCLLYQLTKIAFKKENINLFIEGFLWFVFVNLIYVSVQNVGYDFMFSKVTHGIFDSFTVNTGINGFMNDDSILAILLALAIPILTSRKGKFGIIVAMCLFFPLYLCKTALCFLAGLVGFLFILYFRIPRLWFIALILPLIVVGGLYLNKVDRLGTERFPLWKNVMADVMVHPITGWGLDSFRNVTPFKDFRYSNQVTTVQGYTLDGKPYGKATEISWWDNPHNLYISLAFEFGILGLFIFGCYLRGLTCSFLRSVKTSNAIGLFGFALIFCLISVGHFPAFLARIMVFAVPMFALLEISME